MAHIGIAGDHAGPSCSAWVASLHDITMRIYSKEAQDGILQAIFKLVQATNKQAVEFGLSVPGPPPNRARRERLD